MARGLLGNKNAAGPHKKSSLGAGLSVAKSWAVGGTQIGGIMGAYAAHKGSKALGMQTTRAVLTKGVLKGAGYGLRTSIPTALAIGTATAIGSHVLKKRAEQRSVKGRAFAAVAAVKRRVKNG